MPKIKVDTGAIRDYESILSQVTGRVRTISSDYASIVRNLDWDIKAEANINRRVDRTVRQLASECQALKAMGDFLDTASGKYEQTEDSISNNRKIKDDHIPLTAKAISSFKDRIDDYFKKYKNSKNGFVKRDKNGKLEFDYDKLCSFLGRNKNSISDKDRAEFLETVALMPSSLLYNGSLFRLDGKKDGVLEFGHVQGFSNSEKKRDEFSVLSAFNNKGFLDFLNTFHESDKDMESFGSSLLKGGFGPATLSLFGVEGSRTLSKIFGTKSVDGFLAKFNGGDSFEGTLGKLEDKLKSKGKFDKAIKYFFDDKDLGREYKGTGYADKNGVIDEKNAPDFYDKSLSLLEVNEEAKKDFKLLDMTWDNDFLGGGSVNLTAGEAEAHADIGAGLYVLDKDGNKKFSPGINAECGTSVTGVQVKWDQQWLGDENLGVNTEVTATAGHAEAKAEAGAQFYDENGNIKPQVNIGGSAEAIAGEVDGKAAVNVLGGEVGVKGSLNYGIGAKADFGFKDGVVKADLGLTLGVGAEVGFEVDVGGMVDTVCDAAESHFNW